MPVGSAMPGPGRAVSSGPRARALLNHPDMGGAHTSNPDSAWTRPGCWRGDRTAMLRGCHPTVMDHAGSGGHLELLTQEQVLDKETQTPADGGDEGSQDEPHEFKHRGRIADQKPRQITVRPFATLQLLGRVIELTARCLPPRGRHAISPVTMGRLRTRPAELTGKGLGHRSDGRSRRRGAGDADRGCSGRRRRGSTTRGTARAVQRPIRQRRHRVSLLSSEVRIRHGVVDEHLEVCCYIGCVTSTRPLGLAA